MSGCLKVVHALRSGFYALSTHDASSDRPGEIDSIDAIQEALRKQGYDLSWGPGLTPSGKTKMAFVDDPDGYEIELLETRE